VWIGEMRIFGKGSIARLTVICDENIGMLCIISLMVPIQTEMYNIRMYPKHPKATRREKASAYVGEYYNPNPDPKADPFIMCNPKREERVMTRN
jgi:hypothetical protein